MIIHCFLLSILVFHFLLSGFPVCATEHHGCISSQKYFSKGQGCPEDWYDQHSTSLIEQDSDLQILGGQNPEVWL